MELIAFRVITEKVQVRIYIRQKINVKKVMPLSEDSDTLKDL